MFKSIITFLVVFAIFYFGIKKFTALSGDDMLSKLKLVAYSALCTFLSIGLLTVIVILF